VALVTDRRPRLGVLLALAIAGGILPDPSALAILLASLSSALYEETYFVGLRKAGMPEE
jgi:hypothetical protein